MVLELRMWNSREMFSDSFETYKTFKRSIIYTEFEHKVYVQNRLFGWIRFEIFVKLLNNEDKK